MRLANMACVPVVAGVLALALLAGAEDGAVGEAEVLKALCGGRDPCRLVRTHDAGSDAAGRTMLVVEVALHDRPGESWKGPDLVECAPWEVWLVKLDGAEVFDRRRVLDLCNDGYGASGVGEDMLGVGPNSLFHSRYGGSAWRWYEETTYRLDPFKVTAFSSGLYWGLGAAEESRTWDFTTYVGRVEWYQPDCPELGEPGEWEDEDLFVYQPIPVVDVAPELAASGWQDVAIGTCSLRVDATGAQGRGFVIQGTPGAAGDGSMSAVFVSPTELLVEVRDDVLALGKKSWRDGDHVEIWTGEDPAGAGQCLPEAEPALEWGVGLTSGSVFPGRGDPDAAAISVERVETADPSGKVVRLKITFGERPELVTVVFSDSDGKGQERLLATSMLRPSKTMSLGRAEPIPPLMGVCRVVAGKLDFEDG